MLSDKDKVFLLKNIRKQMKRNNVSLEEIIALYQETAEYLKTLVV